MTTIIMGFIKMMLSLFASRLKWMAVFAVIYEDDTFAALVAASGTTRFLSWRNSRDSRCCYYSCCFRFLRRFHLLYYYY